jgi:CRISPR-associated protein Cas1
MRLKNLRLLPKVRDSWSYVYVDRCRIEKEGHAVALYDERGWVPIPCASLGLLMIGPGTSITHAAVMALADNGCLVAWVGEAGVRFYAVGQGEARSAARLQRQAALWADPVTRLETVVRMYRFRLPEGSVPADLSLRQLRGLEGARVREAYRRISEETGVPWRGRQYRPGDLVTTDPINRAISTANACLYGICHTAIVSAGYSPGLGFIHTGNMLSFVFDIADLYKMEVAIPIAFRVVAAGEHAIEARVRAACRDAFYRSKLLERIIPDIGRILQDEVQEVRQLTLVGEEGRVQAPVWLWDPSGDQAGGQNYAAELSDEPKDAAP